MFTYFDYLSRHKQSRKALESYARRLRSSIGLFHLDIGQSVERSSKERNRNFTETHSMNKPKRTRVYRFMRLRELRLLIYPVIQY